MDGPEHYAEAERLLRVTRRAYNGGQAVGDEPPSTHDVARAQVHATLALASAVVATRFVNEQEWSGTQVTTDWQEPTR